MTRPAAPDLDQSLARLAGRLGWLGRPGRLGRPTVQVVGVAVGEGDGDGDGSPVGRGVPVGRGGLLGLAEPAGVVRADGLGVTCEVGSGVTGGREVTCGGPGRTDGCSVGDVPPAGAESGLNST